MDVRRRFSPLEQLSIAREAFRRFSYVDTIILETGDAEE
jgi:hypothetical protein